MTGLRFWRTREFGTACVLLAIQFILMGLLGEMIAHQAARADYPVRKRFNLDA